MTGTQIKTLAETLVDDTLTDANVIQWINKCQNEDLGPEARKLSNVSITVTDTTVWNDLPVDFLAVKEIINGSDTDFDNEYTGKYKIRGAKILFDVAGTFTLWYWALPTAVTALTDTPEAHTLMHYPMAIYVAAQHRFLEADADTEESNDGARLMIEYQNAKKKALYRIDYPEQDGTLAIKVV